jgi:hypothetical protein
MITAIHTIQRHVLEVIFIDTTITIIGFLLSSMPDACPYHCISDLFSCSFYTSVIIYSLILSTKITSPMIWCCCLVDWHISE